MEVAVVKMVEVLAAMVDEGVAEEERVDKTG